MARGIIRPLTIEQAVKRARSMVGYKPELPANAPAGTRRQNIKYRLTKVNGGKDPYAPHPAGWSYGNRTPTCDCAGFVAWCLGYDRYQPGKFEPYGGWINTDSAIMHAEQYGEYFEKLEAPEVGCLVVTRSVFGKDSEGKRKRIKVGHVGMVVGPLPAEWGGNYSDLRVIHCSASNSRRGGAIKETSGRAFRRGGVFLRYLKGSVPTLDFGG